MTPEQIKLLIREELANFIGTESYHFQKHIQLFDGRHIQTGKTTGTKIGMETSQKIGFYNTTPVDQPATVSDPTAAGGTYNQAVAQSSVDAIKALIDRLQELGLIA